MKYKLVISDYDGTLGGAPLNTIDSETLSAIKKFQDKGGKFVVCTGRMFSSAQRICKSANLSGLCVSFQGAMIKDIESGTPLLEGGLTPKESAEVVLKFVRDDTLALAYIGEKLYYQTNEKYAEYIKIYASALKTEVYAVCDLAKEILSQNKMVSKMCALCEPEKVNILMEKYNGEYDKTDVMFNSGAKYLLECINKKYNKGEAVKFLAKHYNIPLTEVLTVGDSTNDIPLLCGEWHGVAVGDASEKVKSIAKEVTVDFKDKPVKYLLEKYCL